MTLTTATLLTIAVPLAIATSVVGTWAQALRLTRSSSGGGLDPWAWGAALFASSLWMSYGLTRHIASQVAANVLTVSGTAVLLWLLSNRHHVDVRRPVHAALGAVATVVVLDATLAHGLLPATAATVSVWSTISATVTLKRSADVDGASISGLGITLVASCSWLAVGALTAAVPVMATCLVTTPLNAFRLAVVAKPRGQPWAMALAATYRELIPA